MWGGGLCEKGPRPPPLSLGGAGRPEKLNTSPRPQETRTQWSPWQEPLSTALPCSAVVGDRWPPRRLGGLVKGPPLPEHSWLQMDSGSCCLTVSRLPAAGTQGKLLADHPRNPGYRVCRRGLCSVFRALEENTPVTEALISPRGAPIQVLAWVPSHFVKCLCLVQRRLGLNAGECWRSNPRELVLAASCPVNTNCPAGAEPLETAEEARKGAAATTCCPHYPFRTKSCTWSPFV